MNSKKGLLFFSGSLLLLCLTFLPFNSKAMESGEMLAETAAGPGTTVNVLVEDNLEAATAAKDKPQEEIGPGIVKKEDVKDVPPEKSEPIYRKGESLGMFSTTAYCGCVSCSGGSGLTYSGTVPRSGHTISADLSVLPLGTKVMINNTVYTVEDIGSGVDGHVIDIYFTTHEEALNYGRQQQEVFTVIEE